MFLLMSLPYTVHRIASWIGQTLASQSYASKDEEQYWNALGEAAGSSGGMQRSGVSHPLCWVCAL